MEIYEIKPNLYQASAPDEPQKVIDLKPDLIIDLTPKFDAQLNEKAFIYWGIDDLPWMPDEDILWGIAQCAWTVWSKGKRVLTHCQAGCNRSGLMNGCILFLSGMNGKDALDLIWKQRPGALVNPVELVKETLFGKVELRKIERCQS